MNFLNPKNGKYLEISWKKCIIKTVFQEFICR